MKRVMIALLAGMLIFVLTLPAAAVNQTPGSRVADGAGLLTESERNALVEQLDALSEQHSCDIVVVTAASCGGKTPQAYADDYYDQNGYGQNRDGVLLLVSMEERDWYISTTGRGIDVFSDAIIEKIGKSIRSYLSASDYSAAFQRFASLAGQYLNGAKTPQVTEQGQAQGITPEPELETEPESGQEEHLSPLTVIIAACAIGLAAALAVTLTLKSKMNSVQKQVYARNYIRGGVQLTRANEIFLYRTVNRTALPKENNHTGSGSSTHRSSSGTRHGGGGGKF